MAQTLKPDVRQMLTIGRDCGLDDLEEAYCNYMNHYDCFFLIDDYAYQYSKFKLELINLGFVDDNHMVDMTIDEALSKL